MSVLVPVPYCLDDYSLKSGIVMPPALVFFFKIALAIRGEDRLLESILLAQALYLE